MHVNAGDYYYGSYGLVRGFGPLFQSLKDADDSVYADGRLQRKNGGCSDRNVVLVVKVNGLCWWWEETSEATGAVPADWVPVKMADGRQAAYPMDTIRGHEALWAAGFARC